MRITRPLAPVPKSVVARQAKVEAQAIREAEKRILRDTEVARVRAAHAAQKAAALADIDAQRIEAELFATDQVRFAAEAAAEKSERQAVLKAGRDARYAARAAKRSR